MRYPLLIALSLVAVQLSAGAATERPAPQPKAELATLSVQEHYSAGLKALEAQEWVEGERQMQIVLTNFPDSPFAEDALFYKGVARFARGDLEGSNALFSKYVADGAAPSHFEEVFQYKFQIAELFSAGYRAYPFNWDRGPRWASGKEKALALYDEVVTTLPSSELAARSLYSKALLLQKMRQFSEGAERLQTLIARFPRHELSVEAYLAIGKLYLEQAKVETHNPDLLSHAELNLRRFRDAFPSDGRLLEAEELLDEMRETFASGLFQTGQFYERTDKVKSAAVFYNSVLRTYPHTPTAERCRERLAEIES